MELMAQQQQQQQQAQDSQEDVQLQSLLGLPRDVWGHILSRTEPKDVCILACASPQALVLASTWRRGVLMGRHCWRVQLRALRHSMGARGTFVSEHCSLGSLSSREACQASILDTLQTSPDPLPDLAAAVQKGIALITSQTCLHSSLAAPIRSDLVRCANFVCLLAWRQHRSKRCRQAATAAQAQPGAAAAAGPLVMPDGAQALQQQHAADVPQQQQQQQPQAGPGLQAAAVQTELGPSLQELQELMTGFSTLVASPGNPSLRLIGPSLNLLQHLLAQQLQAWNLPQPPGAAAPEPQVVAAAGAAAAAGGDGAPNQAAGQHQEG